LTLRSLLEATGRRLRYWDRHRRDKISGAVVSEKGEVLRNVLMTTPASEEGAGTPEVILRMIDELRANYPMVEAVGVGAAGMVDWPSGHIRWAPNNVYRDLPLRTILLTGTGLPTFVDNDANVAAWAEYRLGRGRGRRYLAFLTVGTGIGAGLVLGGELYRGPTGIGGEVGHIIVNPSGEKCGCGNSGCLEAMASGVALGRAGQKAARQNPASVLATLARNVDKVTGETVYEAAKRADMTARSLFEQVGYWLGIGVASLVTLLDVEIVAIGGGLSATGELLLGRTRASFERFIFASERRVIPQIVRARFGGEAGVIGAAILALDMLKVDYRKLPAPVPRR
jgi:glucokinase